MAGIQEADVWQAADALLLEGGRPTIDRIRSKLGRGSPNTVSGHLETWFKHLGGRIKDPGAFAAPPDVPDPVLQAAKHFWEVAQAQSRLDFDQRLQEGLQAAVANVEAEKERAAIAEAAAFEASGKLTRAQSELADLHAQLDQARLEAAASTATLQEARSRLAEVTSRLQQTEAATAMTRDEARRDVAQAQERAAAAERRAALEVEAERTARAKADKREQLLEVKLESAAQELHVLRTQQAEQAAAARAEAARLAQALESAAATNEGLRGDLAAASSELAELRRQAQDATSAADLAERVIAAFNSKEQRGAAARRSTKRVKHA